MDIICAKCGKHFSSIEAARDHRGNCRETSKGEPIHWLPAQKSKITPVEWENLMRLINTKNPSPATSSTEVEPNTTQSERLKGSSENQPSSRQSSASPGNFGKKDTPKNTRVKRGNLKIPSWVIALLFVFSLSICGLGISLFVGFFIPLWVSLGFSLIFSIQKWFSYQTRGHKSVGKLYRLTLNLTILAVLGLLIWSGIKLFSQQFAQSSLAGSLVFLGEFVFFIWMWRVVSKNSWRWPSMKLTIFSLLAITIVFAFAGVQPISSYKDTVITKWGTYWSEQKVRTEEQLAQAKIDEQKRIEEQKVAEQIKIAEQKAKEAQIQTELNQNYAQLFNDFRTQNGRLPLTFDSRLNELARQRAIEISQPGNFNHEGIKKYNLGENIAMMAYSTDSNSKLLEQWANSPGHRSNMLSSMYARTGFARVGRYAVQIFD